MKKIKFLCIFFCVASSSFAQQALWGRPDIPISSRDRVYTADRTSNTVSAIDPSSTNDLLGVMKLGRKSLSRTRPLLGWLVRGKTGFSGTDQAVGLGHHDRGRLQGTVSWDLWYKIEAKRAMEFA
jgi:hypothetical protein